MLILTLISLKHYKRLFFLIVHKLKIFFLGNYRNPYHLNASNGEGVGEVDGETEWEEKGDPLGETFVSVVKIVKIYRMQHIIFTYEQGQKEM